MFALSCIDLCLLCGLLTAGHYSQHACFLRQRPVTLSLEVLLLCCGMYQHQSGTPETSFNWAQEHAILVQRL